MPVAAKDRRREVLDEMADAALAERAAAEDHAERLKAEAKAEADRRATLEDELSKSLNSYLVHVEDAHAAAKRMMDALRAADRSRAAASVATSLLGRSVISGIAKSATVRRWSRYFSEMMADLSDHPAHFGHIRTYFTGARYPDWCAAERAAFGFNVEEDETHD